MNDNASRSGNIDAGIFYLADRTDKPVIDMNVPGSGTPTRLPAESYLERTVSIHNARVRSDSLSLDRQGFFLEQHRTSTKDFFDDEVIRNEYYPETIELIKCLTGAVKVIVFDHTVWLQSTEKQRRTGAREVVLMAHNDYTNKSGPQRVTDLVDVTEANHRLQKRYAIFNVWRPIAGPVESMPLALCDAGTVSADDLVATDLRYGDRTGEIYLLFHGPQHMWYYFPTMNVDEVAVFKCFDSVTDGRARFTPHTGFVDPGTTTGANPRESIELRTLAFF